MRELLTPPSAVVDPRTREPRIGSYRGALPIVDLGPLGKGPLFRVAHEKRWIYLAIASPDVFVALAVVRLGYLANTFIFVFDRAEKRMRIDRSALGPPMAARVRGGGAEGPLLASFRVPGTSVRIERANRAFGVDVEMKGVSLHARLDAASAPPPIGVVGHVPGGGLNTTEKGALLPVTGEVVVGDRRFDLDGGLGGYDLTVGYLARHTTWRWAFALGRAKSGERVGLNLVEGFVGEPECALWVDDELYPLAEGRFGFERERPLDPWRIRTEDGAVDLVFTPGALHAEHKDFKIIRSLFIQPAGEYAGTIDVAGRKLELDGVLGVAEDQDMLW